MMMQSIIANSRTAEQQNSRTAEQQNSRTAEQQNSRTNSASFFETLYKSDSIKNTFLICIYVCQKSVLFRYGGIRVAGKAEVTDG
jgi:hypothetical protein